MNTNVMLDLFLKDHFAPDFRFECPLFYNAPVGIRFEIGNPDPEISDEDYFKQVNHRVLTLFKDMHQANDDLLIVYYDCFGRVLHKPKRIKPVKRLFLNPDIVRTLSCISWRPYDEDDIEDGWEYYRYVLKCKAADIHVRKLLFSDRWLYIVNLTQNTAFHFYDSRGLDIISGSADALRELYHKRNDWILDYDRDKINSFFA